VAGAVTGTWPPSDLIVAPMIAFARETQHGVWTYPPRCRPSSDTAVRVSELVHIEVGDVDLDACKIFINRGKGATSRLQKLIRTPPETLFDR
jgi:hypothetical protein